MSLFSILLWSLLLKILLFFNFPPLFLLNLTSLLTWVCLLTSFTLILKFVQPYLPVFSYCYGLLLLGCFLGKTSSFVSDIYKLIMYNIYFSLVTITSVLLMFKPSMHLLKRVEKHFGSRTTNEEDRNNYDMDIINMEFG